MPNTSICLNKDCLTVNSLDSKFCEKCGEKVLLKDRYQAMKLIGQGGFGRTFLARDLDKPSQPFCVIKQFFPMAQGTDNLEKASKLFAQEAIRLEHLGKHPQIPELFAYFVTDDQQEYLVQEYIAGQNLEDELKSQGVYDQNQVKELLIDVLKVLQFIHKNQVIHRDIKPENIIRRESDGKLVLVDFGASKLIASPTALNVTGTVIGSAQYWSPEQSRGKPVFASDLYSLGVTCLYLLTNVDPFQLFDINENDWVWKDYLKDNPVSDDLAEILDKLITVALKKRFQSVDEVLEALNINNIKPSTQTSQEEFTLIQSSPVVSLNNQPKIEKVEFYLTTIKQVSKQHPNQDSGWATTTSKIDQSCQVAIFDLGQGVNLEMVDIPGGSFDMGSNHYHTTYKRHQRPGACYEIPVHKVNIKPFYMGKYPVTQAQYAIINGAEPSYFAGENRPVEQVSWDMAQEFCQRLSEKFGKRFYLPSESQWEYACRAGTMTDFYFGNSLSLELANFYTDSGYRESTDVGIFPPNAFGLYDMHGNVWEWCEDSWHENYNGHPDDGNPWIENSLDNRIKVLRGGCWGIPYTRCVVTSRAKEIYQKFSNIIGFRVCMDP